MTEEQHPVLVDSNVFIDLLRQGNDPMRVLLDRFPLTDLVTCGVVKAEVLRGVKSLKARDRLTEFFGAMHYVHTDEALWDEAWQNAAFMIRRGKTIPLTDLVIAACARRAGARVLTAHRHFDHIPWLNVLRP